MPLQNRVLPTGDIVAIPARGTLTGNRGIIHRDDQTLGVARWSHHAWICCTLDWQGRTRQLMNGRNWTELFFLDEAVAFAAGHRPCGYCRREAYQSYVRAWTAIQGTRPSAKQMDKALHAARVLPRQRKQQTYQETEAKLPFGTMVWHADTPHLLTDNAMLPYQPGGYGVAVARQAGALMTVLTPRHTVQVLAAGYRPAIHPSARL